MGRWRRDELNDIDIVAINRAVTSDDIPPLTMGERFLAVIELRRRGMSQVAIGAQLRINQRQVCRYLQVAGLTATGHIPATDWSAHTRSSVQEAGA